MAPGVHAAFAALVGLAWAEAQPDVCCHIPGTARRAFLRFAHRPAAIDAWGQTRRARCSGRPVAVCRELHQGPLGSALRNEDGRGLLPVPPRTGARYREACTPSRAKDAPPAAALQVELLLTHRDQLTPLQPQSPAMRALAQLVAPRRRLVGAKGRCTHRLPSARKHSLLQVLPWVPAKDPALLGDVLSHGPLLKAAPRARRSPLAGCCRAHHGRSADGSAPRLQALQRAMALPTDDGGSAPQVLLVPALVAQLRVTWQAIADGDTAMAPRAPGPPDFPWFDALPGAGGVLAPRLLVAFGEHRERCTSAADLQNDAGLAPGTERSGTKSWGPWRLPGPTLLRQTFVAGAAESTRQACGAQVASQQQRDKGQAHQAAVRALACPWSRLLVRGWQAHTPDAESVYRQARTRRSAPLLHNLAKGA
jgi:Transposase IS116/IS110/IS902 family